MDGQGAHHPTLRHHLHPCPSIRNGRADDVTAEWPLFKNSPSAQNKTGCLGVHRTDSYAVRDSPAIVLPFPEPHTARRARSEIAPANTVDSPIAIGIGHHDPHSNAAT